ncbi:hypothetical protein KIPB_001334 [Kipferlia bialata]|uniref:EGF-like domain-containing protein n=1 Tax=Kipferlia bialata TaxID=797122 RepID=A0A9K3CNL2_9EUKA|nr:hypothetical protein KIPB_001334 [Kipferlia bialata]|eukprot:g1334.t1
MLSSFSYKDEMEKDRGGTPRGSMRPAPPSRDHTPRGSAYPSQAPSRAGSPGPQRPPPPAFIPPRPLYQSSLPLSQQQMGWLVSQLPCPIEGMAQHGTDIANRGADMVVERRSTFLTPVLHMDVRVQGLCGTVTESSFSYAVMWVVYQPEGSDIQYVDLTQDTSDLERYTADTELFQIGGHYEVQLCLGLGGDIPTTSVYDCEWYGLQQSLKVITAADAAHSLLSVASVTETSVTVLLVGRDQNDMVSQDLSLAPVALVGDPSWSMVGMESDYAVFKGVYETAGDVVLVSLEVGGEAMAPLEIHLHKAAESGTGCQGGYWDEEAIGDAVWYGGFCYSGVASDYTLCPPYLSGLPCTTPTFLESPLGFGYAPELVYISSGVTQVYPFLEMPLLPSIPLGLYDDDMAYVLEDGDKYMADSYTVSLECGDGATISIDAAALDNLPGLCTVGTGPLSLTCPIGGNTLSAALQLVRMDITSVSPHAQEIELSTAMSWSVGGDDSGVETLTKTVVSAGVISHLTSLSFNEEVVLREAVLTGASVELQYLDSTGTLSGYTADTPTSVSLHCAGTEAALDVVDSYTILSMEQVGDTGVYTATTDTYTPGDMDTRVVCRVLIDGSPSPTPLSLSIPASAAGDQSSLSVTPEEVELGGYVSIDCTLIDLDGYPIIQDVHVSLTLDGVTTYEPLETDGTPGHYSSEVFVSHTKAGTVDVTLLVNKEAVPSLTHSVTVLAGDVDPSYYFREDSSPYTTYESLLGAFGGTGICSSVTFTCILYDQYGNPVTGQENVQLAPASTPMSDPVGPFDMSPGYTAGHYLYTSPASEFTDEGLYAFTVSVDGTMYYPDLFTQFYKESSQQLDFSTLTFGDGYPNTDGAIVAGDMLSIELRIDGYCGGVTADSFSYVILVTKHPDTYTPTSETQGEVVYVEMAQDPDDLSVYAVATDIFTVSSYEDYEFQFCYGTSGPVPDDYADHNCQDLAPVLVVSPGSISPADCTLSLLALDEVVDIIDIDGFVAGSGRYSLVAFMSVADTYGNMISDVAGGISLLLTNPDGSVDPGVDINLFEGFYAAILDTRTKSGEYSLSVLGEGLPSMDTPFTVQSDDPDASHSLVTVTGMSETTLTALLVGRDQYDNPCAAWTDPDLTQIGYDAVYTAEFDNTSEELEVVFTVGGEEMWPLYFSAFQETTAGVWCEELSDSCYLGAGGPFSLCPPSLSGESCDTPTYQSTPIGYGFAPEVIYARHGHSEVYPFIGMPMLPTLPALNTLETATGSLFTADTYTVELESGPGSTLSVDTTFLETLSSPCVVGSAPFSLQCPIGGSGLPFAIQTVSMEITGTSPHAEEISLTGSVVWTVDGVEESATLPTRYVMSAGVLSDLSATPLSFNEPVLRGTSLSGATVELQYLDATGTLSGYTAASPTSVSLHCGEAEGLLDGDSGYQVLALEQDGSTGVYTAPSDTYIVGTLETDTGVYCRVAIDGTQSPKTLYLPFDAVPLDASLASVNADTLMGQAGDTINLTITGLDSDDLTPRCGGTIYSEVAGVTTAHSDCDTESFAYTIPVAIPDTAVPGETLDVTLTLNGTITVYIGVVEGSQACVACASGSMCVAAPDDISTCVCSPGTTGVSCTGVVSSPYTMSLLSPFIKVDREDILLVFLPVGSLMPLIPNPSFDASTMLLPTSTYGDTAPIRWDRAKVKCPSGSTVTGSDMPEGTVFTVVEGSANVALISSSEGSLPLAIRNVSCALPVTEAVDAPKTYTVAVSTFYAYQYSDTMPTVFTQLTSHSMDIVVTHTPVVDAAHCVLTMPSDIAVGGVVTTTLSLYDEYDLPVDDADIEHVTLSCPSECGLTATNMSYTRDNVYSISLEFGVPCSGVCTAYIDSTAAGTPVSIDAAVADYISQSTVVSIYPLAIYADGTVSATAVLKDSMGADATSDKADVQLCVGETCTAMVSSEGTYSVSVQAADLTYTASGGSITPLKVYVSVDGVHVSYPRTLSVLQHGLSECTHATPYYQSRTAVVGDPSRAETASLSGCMADVSPTGFNSPVLKHLITMQDTLTPLSYAQLDGDTSSDSDAIVITVACSLGVLSWASVSGVSVAESSDKSITLMGTVEDIYSGADGLVYTPPILSYEDERVEDTITVAGSLVIDVSVLFAAPSLAGASVQWVVPSTATAGEAVPVEFSIYDKTNTQFTDYQVIDVVIDLDGVMGTLTYLSGVYTTSFTPTVAGTATFTLSITELVGDVTQLHTQSLAVEHGSVSAGDTLVWLDTYSVYPSGSVEVYAQLRDMFNNPILSSNAALTVSVSSGVPESMTFDALTCLYHTTIAVSDTPGVTEDVVVTVDSTPLPPVYARVIEAGTTCVGCASETGLCAIGHGVFDDACVCSVSYGGTGCATQVSTSPVGIASVRNGLVVERDTTLYPLAVSPVGFTEGIAKESSLTASTTLSLSVCVQAGIVTMDSATHGLISSDTTSVSGCLSISASLADMPSVAASVEYISTVPGTVHADTFDRLDISFSTPQGIVSVAKVPLSVTFTYTPLDVTSAVLSLSDATAGTTISGELSLSDVNGFPFVFPDLVDIEVECTQNAVGDTFSAVVSYVDADDAWAVSVGGITHASEVCCTVRLDGTVTSETECVSVTPAAVHAALILNTSPYLILGESMDLLVQVEDQFGNVVSDASTFVSVTASDGVDISAGVSVYDASSLCFRVPVTATTHPTQIQRYSPLSLSVTVTGATALGGSASASMYATVYDTPSDSPTCLEGTVVGVETDAVSHSMCLCDAGYYGDTCSVSHGFPLSLSGMPSNVEASPFQSMRPFRTGLLSVASDADDTATVTLTVECEEGQVTPVGLSTTPDLIVTEGTHSLSLSGSLAMVQIAADNVMYIPAPYTTNPSLDTVTVSVGAPSASPSYSFDTVYTERWTSVTASTTPVSLQPVALAPNSGSAFSRDLDLNASLGSVTSLYMSARLTVDNLSDTDVCSLNLVAGSESASALVNGPDATLLSVSATDSASLSMTVTCGPDGAVDNLHTGFVTYCLADSSAMTSNDAVLLGDDMTAYTQYVAQDYASQVTSFGTVVFCNRVSVSLTEYPLVVAQTQTIEEDTGLPLSFMEIEHLPLFAEAQDDALTLSVSSLHGSFTLSGGCSADGLDVLELTASGPSALTDLLADCCYTPNSNYFGSDTLRVTAASADRDMETVTDVVVNITSVPDAPVLSDRVVQYMPLGSTIYAMPELTSVEAGTLTLTVSLPDSMVDNDDADVASFSLWGVCNVSEGCSPTSVTVGQSSTEYAFTGSAADISDAISHLGITVTAPLSVPSTSDYASATLHVGVTVIAADGLTAASTVQIKVSPSSASLSLSDDLTHISGTTSNVSFETTGKVDCSSVFDTATAESFGTAAVCLVSNVSPMAEGGGSDVSVFFGAGLTFLPSEECITLRNGLTVQSQTDSGVGNDSQPCILGDMALGVSLPDYPTMPVATITGPSSVYSEALVSLSGRESDSVGTFSRPLSYLWTLANLSNPNMPPYVENLDMTTPTLIFEANEVLLAGNSYSVGLTVTSVLGYTSSATTTVSVGGTLSPTMTLENGTSQQSTYGETLSLRVRAEHPVSTQRGVISFEWTCEDGPQCSGLEEAFQAYTRPYLELDFIEGLSFSEDSTHVVTVTGEYPISHVDHTAQGSTSVTIYTPYAEPEACISTPSAVVKSTDTLVLTSCSVYYDSLEWTLPPSWVVLDTSAADQSELGVDVSGATSLASETFDVTLRAHRTIDGEDYTAEVSIYITVVSTTKPLVSVSHTPSLVLVSAPVVLVGSASSSAGGVTYLWSQTGGPTLPLTDTEGVLNDDLILSESLTESNLVLDAQCLVPMSEDVYTTCLLPLTEYTFCLTVTDDNGTSSSIHAFTTHSGPISGTLSVSVESERDESGSNLYHDEEVSVSTSGWAAINHQTPLTFAFTARLEGSTTRTTLQARSASRSSLVRLPLIGDVYIGVTVIDAVGAETYVETEVPLNVILRPDTDPATYLDALSTSIDTLNETGDTDVSVCVIMAASSYLGALDSEDSTLSSGIATTLISLPTDDLLANDSVQIAAAQALEGVSNTLDSLADSEVESLGDLLHTMTGADNNDSSFLDSSLVTAAALYDRVKASFPANGAVSLSNLKDLDPLTLDSGQTTGLSVLTSVEQMSMGVAASLVSGQRAVAQAERDVSFGAQALTRDASSSVSFFDGAEYTLPSGFSTAAGSDSETGGDTYLSIVSMATPPMGGNSTAFYSGMSTISVSDADGVLDVTDLEVPVGIRIPSSQIPGDLEYDAALEPSLRVKAWNGTAWSEEGITTLGWDLSGQYMTATTTHFTSFLTGIHFNRIENVSELLQTIDTNMTPVYMLGSCLVLYTLSMLVLNCSCVSTVSDAKLERLSDTLFGGDQQVSRGGGLTPSPASTSSTLEEAHTDETSETEEGILTLVSVPMTKTASLTRMVAQPTWKGTPEAMETLLPGSMSNLETGSGQLVDTGESEGVRGASSDGQQSGGLSTSRVTNASSNKSRTHALGSGDNVPRLFRMESVATESRLMQSVQKESASEAETESSDAQDIFPVGSTSNLLFYNDKCVPTLVSGVSTDAEAQKRSTLGLITQIRSEPVPTPVAVDVGSDPNLPVVPKSGATRLTSPYVADYASTPSASEEDGVQGEHDYNGEETTHEYSVTVSEAAYTRVDEETAAPVPEGQICLSDTHAPILEVVKENLQTRSGDMFGAQDVKSDGRIKRYFRILYHTTLSQHDWISIVTIDKGSKRENLTPPRRLTCLVVLLAGIMLGNALFFRADCQEGYANAGQEGLTVDEQNCVPYTVQQSVFCGVVTSLIAIPPSTALRFLFKRTQPIGYKGPKAEKPSTEGKGLIYRVLVGVLRMELSSGWAVFLYIGAVVYILTLMALILLYALQFAETVGVNWMIGIFTGFVQDAFVTDPLKLVVKVFIGLRLSSFGMGSVIIQKLAMIGIELIETSLL